MHQTYDKKVISLRGSGSTKRSSVDQLEIFKDLEAENNSTVYLTVKKGKLY